MYQERPHSLDAVNMRLLAISLMKCTLEMLVPFTF
jgi:hypothetical protein